MPVTLTPARERLTYPSPFLFSFLLLLPSFISLGSFILALPFSSILFYRVLVTVICDPGLLSFPVDFRLFTPGARPGCTPPFLPYRPWTPNLHKRPIFPRPFCCAKITDEALDIHSESVPDTARTRLFDRKLPQRTTTHLIPDNPGSDLHSSLSPHPRSSLHAR